MQILYTLFFGAVGGFAVVALPFLLNRAVRARYATLKAVQARYASTAVSADPLYPLRFKVSGEIDDIHGGGDGAYSLIGTWTAEELARRLCDTLQQPIRELLMQGTPFRGVGHVIKLQIYDFDPGNPDSEDED